MNLHQIRQWFIDDTGRFDLADDSIAALPNEDRHDVDAGADKYIRAACRTLDKEQDTENTVGIFEYSLAIDGYEILINNCRSVKSVNLKDSDDELTPLDLLGLAQMRVDYPSVGSTDNGTTKYYTIYPVVRPPEQRSLGDAVSFMGIYVMPPTDEIMTAIVDGVFGSLVLNENIDENFWSVEHPDILVLATMRELEGFYRNTKGYNDLNLVISGKLDGIDKDLAEWTTAGSLVMRG